MKTLIGLMLVLAAPAFGQTYYGFTGNSSATQTKAEEIFLQQQQSERYKNHLKELTKEPHIAGTKANERVRDYMAELMA